MKNKSGVRFVRNIVLSVLFILTYLALALTRHFANSVWSDVHAWSGGLLLLGSGMHLSNYLNWMKNFISGFNKKQPNRIRLNFMIDLGMMIFGILCALSASLIMISGQSLLQPWSELHRLSGVLMAGLMGLHILLHWQSIIQIPRASRKPSLPLLEPLPVEGKNES